MAFHGSPQSSAVPGPQAPLADLGEGTLFPDVSYAEHIADELIAFATDELVSETTTPVPAQRPTERC